jgi:hypothetical protein
MQLLSELYTAEADFNFNVDTTHKKTFQIVLSIKSSRWFQFHWEMSITVQQKQEMKKENYISWSLSSLNIDQFDANIRDFNFKYKTHFNYNIVIINVGQKITIP